MTDDLSNIVTFTCYAVPFVLIVIVPLLIWDGRRAERIERDMRRVKRIEREAKQIERQAPRASGLGYVYIIRSSDNPNRIKIGYSQDPLRRLKTLRGSSADIPTLYATAPGTIQMERMLHVKFAQYRLNPRYEWFEFSPEIREFVCATFTLYNPALAA